MSRVSTLVSVKWLADLLSSAPKNVRVLDASWHLPSSGRSAKDEYKLKHISGALFFDIDECADKNSNYEHTMPKPSDFESYVGNLGIDNNTHVILYDNSEKFGLFSAQRVWWTFRVFGHHQVSILDGGFPKWCNENYPTTSEIITPEKQNFKADFKSNLVKSFEDVRKNITQESFQHIDARPSGRFNGTTPEPRPNIKPGHIPKSVNMPFMSIMDRERKVVKSVPELEELFAKGKVDLNKDLTVSCGSGVSACCILLAAHLCGKDDGCLYNGSWTEWYERSEPNERVGCPAD